MRHKQKIFHKAKFKYHDIKSKKTDFNVGYYDINSFSSDESNIALTKKISRNKKAIVIFNIKSRSLIIKGESDAFSHQQNCMLQFLPNSSNQIIYNISGESNYQACVQNIINNQKELLPLSYYDISFDSITVVGLNFNNLNKYALGYGYKSKFDDDKIYLKIYNRVNQNLDQYDISTILSDLNISVKNYQNYYINHLKFIPNSYDFIFLLRRKLTNKKFTSRLIRYSNTRGRFEELLNEGHVSHFVWFSNKELIYFGSYNDHENKYHFFNIESKEHKNKNLPSLKKDGHPVIDKINGLIYYDTYPDKSRIQKLYVFNLKENSEQQIDSLYSPTKFFDEFRCDLHPRISPNSNYLCIDHSSNGRRCVRVYEL